MKFNSLEEREDLIKSFEDKSKTLTTSLKSEIPSGTEVSFESVTIWDDAIPVIVNEETKETENKVVSGEIYVMYIKQPHIITSVQIMDKLAQNNLFGAGFFAWGAMVISSSSSPEIEKDDIKLGLCARLAQMVQIKVPDFKKK